MEDHTNLVKDDQLQIDEPRQYPGPQYPGPQHLGSTNTVITAQPVPHVPLIIRSPVDSKVISSIKTKAILSLVMSIVLSLCLWPLFCTIPAIILAILALTGIDTNIYHAADNAKHAATLTCVALGTALILIIIGAIYNVSNGYY
ncbi:uncharacterized protein [Apostichopus japonicus]|uniref:uncharacterized protein n=1 Tax=Stichopus japonicus TaxID=307972 RepID=UPI003AB184F1